ncbi:MAG: GlsB/YeaQ/YmgE family stress response membrane protein [Hyphomicrobium sp.]|uniref:GlsB/YeaQ/YmgE family stress response membrane protein n=1 Tax=Hyphomicrobium sp. TaxID=82 RepID=UPI0039E5C621
MDSQTRDLIVFALIGIVAGFLASLVVGGDGLIRYLITGIIGAFVGGYLFKALGINLGIGNPLISQIITAAIGAIIIVILARLIA